MGAKVALIERFDMPGGVHTSGLQGAAGPGVGGIHTELMERFAAEGHIYTATQDRKSSMVKPIDHLDCTVGTNKIQGQNDHASSYPQPSLAARKNDLIGPCRWLAL